MKKTRCIAAFICVTTIATAFQSCGRIDDVQTEVTDTSISAEKLSVSPNADANVEIGEKKLTEFDIVDESVPYKAFHSPDEIETGDANAIATLSEVFNTEIDRKEELICCEGLEEWAVHVDGTPDDEILQIFLVKDFETKSEGDCIVFLYEDDTKAAVANAEPYDFVQISSIDCEWSDFADSTTGVLAYYNEEAKTSYCIVPQSQGFLTSVWVVNLDQGTATDIYTNLDSPMWSNRWGCSEEIYEEAPADITEA